MAIPIKVTKHYLATLKPSYTKKGYPVPKWITFSETLLNSGWKVQLKRSKSSYSKYIYIQKEDKSYKIRFSNHRPNKDAQEMSDSDFYVGVSNGQVITTEMVLKKILGEI